MLARLAVGPALDAAAVLGICIRGHVAVADRYVPSPRGASPLVQVSLGILVRVNRSCQQVELAFLYSTTSVGTRSSRTSEKKRGLEVAVARGGQTARFFLEQSCRGRWFGGGARPFPSTKVAARVTGEERRHAKHALGSAGGKKASSNDHPICTCCLSRTRGGRLRKKVSVRRKKGWEWGRTPSRARQGARGRGVRPEEGGVVG
jgi:hypothetical protein